ncbi:MAG: TetR/AcrR family transcriptional regulator [Pseudomonadales bacterium]|uniref:TetR family transcriptional regulator n=2 Tax=Oleiphilus messinensis TaxID=141451 RepID=A0A1Y0IEW2_9GAMM|nr:TetR family transcriptional regulator [Oleiphilus messinensis]MCG8612138.1 TetR/AcrR family transcriptional regulator [Pseudomonadales bacterium]
MPTEKKNILIPISEQNPKVRERIEQAAIEVLSQKEFHRVTLSEIANQAGASLQTLYKYYGTKEAIRDACVQSSLSKLAVRMFDHLQAIETYKDKLRKVFWVVLEFCESERQVTHMMINSVYPGNWGSDVTDSQKQLTNTFLTVLREGRELGILTDKVSELLLLDYIYGVLLRVCQMYAVRGAQESIVAQAPELFEMLWRSLAKHPDE